MRDLFLALTLLVAAGAGRGDAPETPAPPPEARPTESPPAMTPPAEDSAATTPPPATPPAEAPSATAPARAAPLPFAPGEQMDFTIDYLGIKMGAAQIKVGEPEGPLLPLSLSARSAGIAAVVDVRQLLVSYLDPATGLPARSLIDAKEQSYLHTDTTVFDRGAGVATVTVKGKYLKVHEVPTPPGTIDFVALVFRLRQLPLDAGARHAFPVLAGTKVSQVVAEVVGRQRVETRAGTFPTVKVRVPTGFTGKFSEKDPTYVWFSDDARRLVVRISTDFAIGRATASLTSVQPGRPVD